MYEKLVFEFPQEYNEITAPGDDPGFVVKPQAYFRGASQIPGSEFNSSFQIFVKPFFLDRVQHRHPKDEYLIFLGASFPNVFDFDADIEFTLGKKGEDEELYHITKPTIIRVPFRHDLVALLRKGKDQLAELAVCLLLRRQDEMFFHVRFLELG